MLSLATDTDMAADMVMAVSMVAMEDTDTARGPPRLRPMLSPDTDTTAVGTDMADMVVTDVSMVDMEDTDMARGPLRLRLSLDMVTTAVAMEDMVATDMDVDTDMVDTADTMDKSKSNGINLHSCTATFILVLKLSLVLPQNFL